MLTAPGTPCPEMRSGFTPEFHKPGRDADIDTVGFGGFRHDRSCADDASLRDFHAVGDGDPGSEPDVIADFHTLHGESLFPDELVLLLKDVVGGNDNGVSCDTDIRADVQSPMAIENAAGVDGTIGRRCGWSHRMRGVARPGESHTGCRSRWILSSAQARHQGG